MGKDHKANLCVLLGGFILICYAIYALTIGGDGIVFAGVLSGLITLALIYVGKQANEGQQLIKTMWDFFTKNPPQGG